MIVFERTGQGKDRNTTRSYGLDIAYGIDITNDGLFLLYIYHDYVSKRALRARMLF